MTHSLEVRRLCRRLRLLNTDPAIHVHLVLTHPSPGAGVMVIPEIAWLKAAQAEQFLDHRLGDIEHLSKHRHSRSAPLVQAIADIAHICEPDTIFMPRPPAWALLAPSWWSAQTRTLVELFPGCNLSRYPEADGLSMQTIHKSSP